MTAPCKVRKAEVREQEAVEQEVRELREEQKKGQREWEQEESDWILWTHWEKPLSFDRRGYINLECEQ